MKKLFQMDFMLKCIVGGDVDYRNDQGSAHRQFFEAYLREMLNLVGLEVQINYFLRQQGLSEDRSSSESEKDDGRKAEEEDLHSYASGSTEDVSRDMALQVDAAQLQKEGKSFYREFARMKEMNGSKKQEDYAMIDATVELEGQDEALHGKLRGGMNKYAPLANEQDEVESDDAEDYHAATGWDDAEEESCDPLEESFHSTSSGGRSFYEEYFARKAAMRGGAGGSSTTTNKKLTEALGALAEVVKNFDTQKEPETAEQIVQLLGETVQTWQQKMPTRNEMKSQLRRFHQLLEKDAHQLAEPHARKESEAGKAKQQSFYGEFVKKFQEEEESNPNKWQTKGKGKNKGKGKGKGKSAADALPRFDIMRILPTKSMTTWQVLGKELEAAKEPTGMAVIMDSVDRMVEYQALSKAHGLTNEITMIAKMVDSDITGVENAVTLWLPYLSNLALVQAVVATTTGTKSTLKGVEPVKKDAKDKEGQEKFVTLRMVVDLKLIAEKKVRDHYKEQPHVSLHHALGKSTFKEIKTHGWTVGDELLTGYCSVRPESVNEILNLSGRAGVFSSRLRQDVSEYPAVTWLRKEDGETDLRYHERALEKAKECNTSLTRRQGGGAYIGLLKEDDEARNHAWQISGIPLTWGPSSVRTWLEENDWHVEMAPKPPSHRHKCWSIQGYSKSEPLRKEFAFQLQCGSKINNITIYRWQKQRKPSKEEKEKDKQLKGARWWSSDMTDPIEDLTEVTPTLQFSPEVAATVMDVDDKDNENGDGTAGKRAAFEGNKGSSPHKKKPKKAAEETLQGGSQGPIGSILLNLGGSGECGWRALSWSIAVANKTSPEQATDNVETLSTTLRVKTMNFLKVNCNRWKESWCVDDAATATTEDGPPAQCYEDFLKVLDRPKRWLCGLGITAVALQLKCTIVVWQFVGSSAKETHDQTKWRRAAIVKGTKGKDNGRPILAVVLHKGHYYALRYPPLRKAWPREWLNSPEEDEHSIPVTQDYTEAAEITTVCRGGGDDPFCTPKKKRSEEKVIDEMLRTFSTQRARSTNRDEEMLRTFSTSRASSSRKKADEVMLKTCEPMRDGSKGSSKKVIKQHLKKDETEQCWMCPICQEKIVIDNRKKATNMIGRHLKNLHSAIYQNALQENQARNRRGTGLGMAGLVKHVAFKKIPKDKWMEEAEFVCPYCEEALPKIGGVSTGKLDARYYMIRLSKRQHLAFDCKHKDAKKGTTLRQYAKDAWAKFGDKYGPIFIKDGKTEEWYTNSRWVEKVKKQGHQPVVFQFAKRVLYWKGKFQMVCVKCRKGLSNGDNERLKQCDGVVSRLACSPGPAFWKQIEINRMKKTAMEKLRMTTTEVAKAYEASSTFRCGKAMKKRGSKKL